MTDEDIDDHGGLGWAHGALTVQRLGALPDGRPPWAGDKGTEGLPGILQRLRGDWPCVPFGYSVSSDGWTEEWAKVMGPPALDEEVRGHCSNHEWRWHSTDGYSLKLLLEYPMPSPVLRVERTITPDPDAPALDLEFRIVVRRRCRLPIGLHPVFRLPKEAGAAQLEIGGFDQNRTYRETVEPGAALFARNVRFTNLAAVPGRSGGTVDASRLPFAGDVEELLQVSMAAWRLPTTPKAIARGCPGRRSIFRASFCGCRTEAASSSRGTDGTWRSALSRSARLSALARQRPWPTIPWRCPARPQPSTFRRSTHSSRATGLRWRRCDAD